MVKLSIIVPALDEAERIGASLRALGPLQARGHEVIVVDGGSRDATVTIAGKHASRVIVSWRGRATQMHAGAAAATGDVLVFLHADNRLPPGADRLVLDGLASSGRAWGRFDVAIDGESRWLRLIAWFMNRRSRLSGIATGDQAMFVRREAYEWVGGFPDIALMEDIALCVRLKRVSRPLCLAAKTQTSGRRWERNGVFRTVFLMWRLRLAYFFGAAPERLHRIYEGA